MKATTRSDGYFWFYIMRVLLANMSEGISWDEYMGFRGTSMRVGVACFSLNKQEVYFSYLDRINYID